MKEVCYQYYVYGVYFNETLVYVGKGKGNRYKHCTSGKSHCHELNNHILNKDNLIVRFIQLGLTEKSALELEYKLLIENHGLYNKDVVNPATIVRLEEKRDELTPEEESIDITVESRLLRLGPIDGKEKLTLMDKLLLSFLQTKETPFQITNTQISNILGVDDKTVSRSVVRLANLGLVGKVTTKHKNLPLNEYVYIKDTDTIIKEQGNTPNKL